MTLHAEGAQRTRVELVHSGLDRHGEGWERVREIVASPGGGPTLRALFTAQAQAAG